MNGFMSAAGDVFEWVLRISWQAGVLAALVLLAQLVFRKKLSPGWRYGLWLLLIARLLMPGSPQSTVSIFNVWMLTPPAQPAIEVPARPVAVAPTISIADKPLVVEPINDRVPAAISTSTGAPNHSINWFAVACAVWAGGVCLLALRLVGSSLRFHSSLARHVPVADTGVLAMMEECKRIIRVTQRVIIIETDGVTSPAVCGIWNKWLLLPDGIFERFSLEELRHIFLHEMAHIKRRDLEINWLAAVLQMVHWFNPVLWLAFARMKADRELATDALVLARVGAAENIPYGETILKALENIVRPAFPPGLVGIAESKASLKERLRAIARCGSAKPWRWLAAAILVIIAVIGLTGAQLDPDTGLSPGIFRIWRDHVVDENPDQPHFAEADAPSPARVTLTGRVVSPEGKSVSAIAVIWCAERRSNATYTVSTRYPHLPRQAQVDGAGNFKFESLDPRWTYDVYIVSPGCQQQRFLSIDPVARVFSVTVQPIIISNCPPNTLMRGRVVDNRGQPVSGALLKVHGTTRNNSTTWPAQEIDSAAMSDDAGNFLVQAKTPFREADGAVSAAGFATSLFEHWKSGDATNDVSLTEGASVAGRLVDNGNPVSNVEFRVDSFGRDTDSDAWAYFSVTDSEGRFLFTHLPHNRQCNLYATMRSLAGRGMVPTQAVSIFGDGSTNDIGAIKVQPAFKIAGRILLRGDRPIPANSQIIIGHSADWYEDAMAAPIGQDGFFQFAGVPAGKITLYLWVPGYLVSWNDLHLKSGPAVSLTLTGDTTNVVIRMKPRTKTDMLTTRLWYLFGLYRL
jgi:beta-lactamase regulating signal transducer with metallopeptidase domain